MSLILDALSRSQRERAGDAEVPSIETQHYHAPIPAQRSWRDIVPWAALGLALLVITYLLMREQRPSQPVEDIEPVVTVEPAPAKPVSAALGGPEASASAPDSNRTSSSDRSVTLPATQEHSQRPDTRSQLSSRQQASAATSRNSDAVAALYKTPSTARDEVDAVAPPVDTKADRVPATQASTTQARSQTTEPVEIAALLERAEQEVAQSRLSEHSAVFLEQLSQLKKDQIPTLMYSRHDYSSQALKSRVVINGKTANVGDTVAPGVTLDEILPDSSVFSFRGTPFRLIALNSWVNL